MHLFVSYLFGVPAAASLANLIRTTGSGRDTQNDLAFLLLALPVLAAGVILLVGGLARWGQNWGAERP